LRAFIVAPELVEPDQRRIGGQAVFDEMTGDREAGAADPGAAVHVDAPAARERRIDRRLDFDHVLTRTRQAVVGNGLA
jgi:hypothetical protein